ncbi:MAG: shikimate dehydrogenase [Ignavibacteriae bacterium]|nr:MAG: shikimate dehydrogenase [Ignavibacteriota bacterium]
MIDHSTKIVGVIGHPIKHSLSPLMHNLSFRKQRLNYAYLPFDVVSNNLKDALKSISALGIRGLNVTIPHKEKIIQYMDHVSEAAASVGAVNTVVNENNQLFGYNTDIDGIIESLDSYKHQLNKCTVTVIGAGGAARSVMHTLIRHFKVEKINVLNRTVERAESIKDYFRAKMHFDGIEAFELMPKDNLKILQKSDLIVNATSIGMSPNFDDTPTRWAESFNSNQIVLDLIYNPLRTKFLKLAESRGATVINGLKMFIVQGAKSFELWTGQAMDIQGTQTELQKLLNNY